MTICCFFVVIFKAKVVPLATLGIILTQEENQALPVRLGLSPVIEHLFFMCVCVYVVCMYACVCVVVCVFACISVCVCCCVHVCVV